MKYLILAASLSLIAAPAFAASAQDAAGKSSQQTAMTATQQHTYSYSGDEGGSIATRNARLQHSAMARSPNAKAAWAGQAHFY
jgi:hypothetical protein